MMPDSFEYAKKRGRKYLFHNLGMENSKRSAHKSGLTAALALASEPQTFAAPAIPIVHRE